MEAIETNSVHPQLPFRPTCTLSLPPGLKEPENEGQQHRESHECPSQSSRLSPGSARVCGPASLHPLQRGTGLNVLRSPSPALARASQSRSEAAEAPPTAAGSPRRLAKTSRVPGDGGSLLDTRGATPTAQKGFLPTAFPWPGRGSPEPRSQPHFRTRPPQTHLASPGTPRLCPGCVLSAARVPGWESTRQRCSGSLPQPAGGCH